MIADQIVRDQVLDITQSFLVQAPAGSGKTSLLVQRFLRLLANVQQYPEEILAITFTRKAAAEMRARVIDALKLSMQAQAPVKEYDRKLWELGRAVLQRDKLANWDLIDNPARLKIQTIDALSSAIAAQMPITAQFGSSPEIEPQAQYLYEQAADQFLLETSTDSPWQSDVNILLLHLDNDRSKVKNLLVNMLERRDQWLPVIVGTLSQNAMRDTLEDALKMVIEQSLTNITENIPEILDFNILQRQIPETTAEWIALAKILLTENEEWRRTVNASHGFPPQSAARDKDEKLLFKERKIAMEQILADLDEYQLFKQQLIAVTKLPPEEYSNAQWHVLDALFKILPLLVAQLTLVFKEQGVVDFSAITLAALRALDAQDAGVNLSLALDCKINHILVDEFQDTSLLQFGMLERLTSNWDDGDKTLFLVGDPMQSIYRFRKAEVGLFLKAKQFGINSVKLNFVQLTVNFRSSASLVNWFNSVFTTAFPDKDDIDFGAISYMPSQAASNENVIDPMAAKCYLADSATEAEKIVEIIRASKEQEPQHSIAILVRAKAHLIDIIPALRAANIEFTAVELESLAHSQFMQDMLALTKAVMHLDDRIAWLAMLRAPWCGLTLADLLILAQQPLTIWAALQDSTVIQTLSSDAQQRVKKLIVVMEQILNSVGRESLDVLVQQLWYNLDGAKCLRDASMQQEAQIFFAFLAQHALDRDIYSPGFLERQLQHLYLHVTTVKPNAVQIMTMHKSKGLEFDVVILPGLGKKIRNDSQKLLLLEQRNDPIDAIIMAPIKSAVEVHDPIYNYVLWCETQRQEYEGLRQLYVAVTRARKQLHCFGSIYQKGPSQHSLLARIWPVIANEFEVLEEVESQVVTELLQPPLRRLSIEHFEKIPMLEQSSVNNYKPTIVHSDWQRLVGIVLHRTLWQVANDGIEQWNLNKVAAQRKVWTQQLRQLCIEAQHLKSGLELLKQALTNTLQEKFAQIILSNQHAETYSEWQLTVYQKDEPVNIILDRAFLDKDQKFWIVDYKFVQHESDIAAAMSVYYAQLNQYARAVQALYANRHVIAGLYFPLQAQWRAIEKF